MRQTMIQLKLLEGQQLTLNEQQYLMEMAPAVLLLSWLKGEAVAWLARQISGAVNGDPVCKRNAATVDSVEAQLGPSLGEYSDEIGTGLSSYVANLIASGNPATAALQTGRQLAKDYARVKAAQAAGQAAVAAGYLDAETVEAIGIELAKVEPQADKLAATAEAAPAQPPIAP